MKKHLLNFNNFAKHSFLKPNSLGVKTVTVETNLYTNNLHRKITSSGETHSLQIPESSTSYDKYITISVDGVDANTDGNIDHASKNIPQTSFELITTQDTLTEIPKRIIIDENSSIYGLYLMPNETPEGLEFTITNLSDSPVDIGGGIYPVQTRMTHGNVDEIRDRSWMTLKLLTAPQERIFLIVEQGELSS